MTQCDVEAMAQFSQDLKLTLANIKAFHETFNGFLEKHQKEAKDLWSWVTRYNILNS